MGEQRNKDGDYYAYGLKIPSISSKAYGAANNNFQYQGDYSEFDDDLGWNDFELRSYDPQIGRFLQNDPYDQFASGYVGIGNDPGNSVDPSGGWGCPATAGLVGFGGMIANAGGAGFNISSAVASWVGIAAKAISLTGQGFGLKNTIDDNLRNSQLSKLQVDPSGNISRAGWSGSLRFGVRLGGTVAGVLYSNPVGEGSDLKPRIRREQYEQLQRRTAFRILYGSDTEDEIIDQPLELYRSTPFSPDDTPPKDPYGRDVYFIYETLRNDKGVIRPYYGITTLRGRGSGGRYQDLNSLQAKNMKIIGIAYKKVAQGIEQSLIELNNDGRPDPAASNRIDNIANSLDPRNRKIEYNIYKNIGQKWLDFYYPDWKKMGSPGQRGQFLRPPK